MAVEAVDTRPAEVRRRMREALEAHDHDGVVALLAPDVVLRSPIIRTHFEDREAVARLLGAVMDRIDDTVYTGEGEIGELQVLNFTARARGIEVNGIDAMRVNADGLVEHITVYIRPMVGLAAVMAILGPPLARTRAHAVVTQLLALPLLALLRAAEPLVPRLVRLRS